MLLKQLCVRNFLLLTNWCWTIKLTFFLTRMQSWAKFEPSKTTVKRIPLQEHHNASMDGSSFRVDQQHFNPHMLDVSATERPLVHTTPSTYSSQDKGEPNKVRTTKFFWLTFRSLIRNSGWSLLFYLNCVFCRHSGYIYKTNL